MNYKNIIGLTAVTFLVTVLIVCCGYLGNTSDRLYLSITEFDLPNGDSCTVGEQSDICFKDVPKDYMTVTYKNGYSYQINNRDSCLYYKINNENPNAHSFTRDSSSISAFGVTKSGVEIIDLLDLHNNEYYMLSEIWAKLDTTWKRSANFQAIEKGEKAFNSFVHKKDGAYKLVILDKTTKIDGKGYCYADTLPQGNEFKIQFFKMNSWSVKKQEKGFWDNKTYLSDSIRSYFAKADQMFTEWGAGHILVRRKEKNFSVTFPKAITTTIPTKTIRDIAQKSETGVYLKQMLKSYPMPTDFYIPAFSNALSEYVCELTKVDTLIFQTANARVPDTLSTSGSFIPKIEVKNQPLVTGGITYKARILNKAFYLSKHWVLFIVWLVLSVVLFFSFPKSSKNAKYDAGKIKTVRWYLCGLFTLFWFFLNQKLLIAEKLTFTYPYFEKIYPVSYLTVLFSFFALFFLIILINKTHLYIRSIVDGNNKFEQSVQEIKIFANRI
jgi:hypothetical protein